MPSTDELAKGSCCARSSVGRGSGVETRVAVNEEADAGAIENDDRLSALARDLLQNNTNERAQNIL